MSGPQPHGEERVKPEPPDAPMAYYDAVARLETDVRAARLRSRQAANAEMLIAYWLMGRTLLAQTGADGWDANVIERLAADLGRELPDMTTLTPGSMRDMCRFAEAWPDGVADSAVGRLPWGHVRLLLDKIGDPATRDSYAAQAVEHGWSQETLAARLESATTEAAAHRQPVRAMAGGAPYAIEGSVACASARIAADRCGQMCADGWRHGTGGATWSMGALPRSKCLAPQSAVRLVSRGGPRMGAGDRPARRRIAAGIQLPRPGVRSPGRR